MFWFQTAQFYGKSLSYLFHCFLMKHDKVKPHWEFLFSYHFISHLEILMLPNHKSFSNHQKFNDLFENTSGCWSQKNNYI